MRPPTVDVVSPTVRGLLAPNPGPMTLDGTNTWVLGDAMQGPAIVVDPGPEDASHLAAIRAAAPYGISVILLTHWHHDHSDLAPALSEATGAPVRAVDASLVRGGAVRGGADDSLVCEGTDDSLVREGTVLADGEVIRAPGVEVLVQLTPGHTADSVCFVVKASETYLLTGDTVLGRGTTVITRPDGGLRAYLTSLDLLSSLVGDHAVAEILPGHGARLRNPLEVLDAYRRHRHDRLDQVRAALAAGDTTVGEVVARVYADVDPSVLGAAGQSVASQLDYLADERGAHPGSQVSP